MGESVEKFVCAKVPTITVLDDQLICVLLCKEKDLSEISCSLRLKISVQIKMVTFFFSDSISTIWASHD
jgi:hypothetical protein